VCDADAHKKNHKKTYTIYQLVPVENKDQSVVKSKARLNKVAHFTQEYYFPRESRSWIIKI